LSQKWTQFKKYLFVFSPTLLFNLLFQEAGKKNQNRSKISLPTAFFCWFSNQPGTSRAGLTGVSLSIHCRGHITPVLRQILSVSLHPAKEIILNFAGIATIISRPEPGNRRQFA